MAISQSSIMRYVSRTSRCGVIFRDEAFKDLGLTGTQHHYLIVIYKNPGIYQHQLAKRLIVNKSNVTRQLNLMEQAGFITRRQDLDNRRQVHIFPTEKAIEAYPKVCSVLTAWNNLIVEGLTDEERTQLATLMDRVYANALMATEGTLELEDGL